MIHAMLIVLHSNDNNNTTKAVRVCYIVVFCVFYAVNYDYSLEHYKRFCLSVPHAVQTPQR